MTTIRYFIPEDGDTELHPNVFLAPKPRQPGQPPLLRDVKHALPLPGTYHFRFKSSLVPGGEMYGKGNNMAVWMDCVADNVPVPVWRNSVICKLTRISADDDEDTNTFKSSASEIPDYQPSPNMSNSSHRNRRVQPPAQQTQPHHQTSAAQSEPLLNVFDEPTPQPAAPASNSTADLIDTTSHNHNSSSGSLLDMDVPPTTTSSANSSTTDFFGTGATTAPAASPSSYGNDLIGMGMHPTPQAQMHTQHHAPNMRTQTTPTQHAQPQYHHQQQQVQPPRQQHVRPMAPQQPQQGYPATQTKKKGGNAFESFSNDNGPFGGLNWS